MNKTAVKTVSKKIPRAATKSAKPRLLLTYWFTIYNWSVAYFFRSWCGLSYRLVILLNERTWWWWWWCL